MKKILSLMIFQFVVLCSSFAQDTYQTRNATLTLNGELNGKALHLQTQALSVRLNYETAQIVISFPLRSLQTTLTEAEQDSFSQDSLSQMLEKSFTEVVFDGKLGLEYVNTGDHPPMKFKTEGFLIIGTSKAHVEGKGELHHMSSTADLACMLGLRMTLNFKDLGIRIPFPGLNENFEAIITQALLQQDKY